jgi:hypothetical protein
VRPADQPVHPPSGSVSTYRLVGRDEQGGRYRVASRAPCAIRRQVGRRHGVLSRWGGPSRMALSLALRLCLFVHREGDVVDTVMVDGLRIAYARTGAGSALVLLHGYVADRPTTWRRQLDELCDEFTVVARDAPGAGGSSYPPEQVDRARPSPSSAPTSERAQRHQMSSCGVRRAWNGHVARPGLGSTGWWTTSAWTRPASTPRQPAPGGRSCGSVAPSSARNASRRSRRERCAICQP